MATNELMSSALSFNKGNKMTLAEIVSKNVKSLRLERGLSQQKLSNKTSLTLRYISRLENENPNITLDVLERLSKGLDCDVTEIVKGRKITGHKNSKLKSKAIDDAISLLKGIKSQL